MKMTRQLSDPKPREAKAYLDHDGNIRIITNDASGYVFVSPDGTIEVHLGSFELQGLAPYRDKIQLDFS